MGTKRATEKRGFPLHSINWYGTILCNPNSINSQERGIMAALSVKDLNRRGIALLLALVLCFNLGATAAFAEEPHEHRYEMTPNVVGPTCTEHGGRYYQCSLCGELSLGDLTEPLGHAWDEGTVAHQPTEVTEGILVYTCTRCGEMKTEAIPALEVPASTDAPAEAVPTEVPETEPDEQEEDEPKEEQTPAAPPAEVPEEKPGEREALNDPSNPPVADTSADLEGAPIWERPFENLMLSGVWAEDLLRIVQTQLDYAESEDNFEPVWNDTTKQWDKNSYTRYGAWYGYPYGGWCAMFLSFCLHYAGVPQEAFPSDASAGNWARALYERGQFAAASTCVPKPGDLIFFDLDGSGFPNHVGVVYAADAAANTVNTVEGNRTPEVCTFAYALTDPHIAGYGILPENPDPQPHYALAASEEAAEEKNTEQASAETAAGSFVPDAPVPDGTELRVEFVEADPSVLEIVKNYVSGPMKADPSEIQAFACIVWLSTPDYTVVPTGAQVTLKTSLPLPVMDDEAEEPVYMKVSDIVAVYASEDGALFFREAKAVTENGAITEVSFYAPEPATYAVCYTLQEPTEESAEEEAKEEESADEAEESFEEIIAFDETVEVAAGSVNVTAGEGVLPEGAVLTVADAPLMLRSAKRMAAPAQVPEEESDAPVSIEESTAEADAEVVIASYRYEISLQDAEGNALQPKDGGSVTLRFALPEGENPNLYARVIHMTDEGPEILNTEKEGNTVVALSDGFSLYTVEFYYEKKQYVLNGDSSAPLSEVLAEIGLAGEVEAVSVSNEELFNAVKDGETGVWVVTALQPFDTQEWMTVTIGGIDYEILVLDALQPVTYWDPATDSEKTCDNYRFVSKVMDNGWYVVNRNTKYNESISVLGNVNLILKDGVTLDAYGGIYVSGNINAKLTIWAQTQDTSRSGGLFALPNKGAAGIGGKKGYPGGEIVINGGRITATGADYCAGIGGADGKSGYRSITINSGSVTATGGFNAAGIGGGDEAKGTLGPVTINGGTVKAKGNNHGAGIGGGDRRSGGPLTVNGGTVEATGGESDYGFFNRPGGAAGIGGGLYAAQGGKVTINGGSVKATGMWGGAGIGGGSGHNSETGAAGGEVQINGGTVVARGQGGAGIGGGSHSPAGNIVINGGTVDAGFEGEKLTINSGGGSGIGAGDDNKTNTGSVTINGGTVTAYGNTRAGIGDVATVRITGGDVAAESAYGAGIGGSYYRDNSCSVTISGGSVIASSIAGGAGIGSGLFGTNKGASVTITGGKVWAFGHTRYINIWAETVGSAAAGNSMKWAKMHDKTQTGGNIASLAGSIGELIMMLVIMGSYNGEYCGAGIGGGHKDSGCAVTITGGEVFAAANKSGVHAIGRGLSGKKDGTLSLGDNLAVCSGNDPTKLEWKKAAERINACQKSLAAYIEPCEHEFTYEDFDGAYHYHGGCRYCLARKSEKVKEIHVFDEKTHSCICGHKEIKLTLEETSSSITVSVSDELVTAYRVLEPGESAYTSEDAKFTVAAACEAEKYIPVITAYRQGEGGEKALLSPEATSQMTDKGFVTEIHTYRMNVDNPDNPEVILKVEAAEACKVSFSPGDAGVNPGVYDMVPVYVPAGQPYTIPACEYEKNPELTNKVFQGWKLSEGHVAEGESGDIFQPGTIVYPLDNLTFTAQWDDPILYPLWVNGNQVTERNKDDVLGDGSGSIQFDANTDTLILNDPRPFTGGTTDDNQRGTGLIYAKGMNLTVKGVGTVVCKYKSNESGILVNGGKLKIGGSVTIDASNYGVYADNGIDFLSEEGKNIVITIQSGYNPAVSVKPGSTIAMTSDLGIITPIDGIIGSTTIRDASGNDAKTVEIMSFLTVRFYPGGGTGAVQKDSVPAGKSYTLPECSFKSPDGYTFKCWQINYAEYAAGLPLSPEKLNELSRKGNLYATAIWAKLDYTLKEWEWQEESEPPTAKAVFAVAGSGEEIKMDATVTKGKTEEPTCTETGSTVYTATVTYLGATYTDSHTKTLSATGHTAGTVVRENEKAVTCTEAGSYDLVTYCSSCGVELKRTHETEEALGHFWSEWKHGETADYRECTRCHKREEKFAGSCSHKMILEAEIPATCTERGVREHYRCTVCMGIFADASGKTEWFYEDVTIPAKGHTAGTAGKENEKAPTCTEAGSYEEVVRCKVCQAEISREVKTEKSALGHAYGEPKWIWADDCSAAQAVFVCRNDPAHRTTADAAVSVKRAEPSCIMEGSETYTATVHFEGKPYQDVKTKALEKTAHIPGPAVTENETPASCTLDGYREKAVYCDYCEKELSREVEIIKALGVHTWSNWVAGTTGYYRTCSVCGLKETKPTETCTHSETILKESKAATCTETGMQEHYRCTNCHELFSDEDGTHILTDAELRNLVIPAKGHTAGTAIRENEKAPTCTESSSYDEVISCSVCGEILSREVKTGESALGHDYGEPKWIWADDCSATQAVFVCTREPSHRINVNAGITEEKTEATCTEEGSIVYTASASFGGKTYTDSKTKTVPATNHTAGTAVKENEKAATCTEKGSYDLVTRCSSCGVELKRTHETIPALGHDWPQEWEHGETADYRECTRCGLKESKGSKTCEHLMVIEPAVEPTCTAQGHKAFYHCAKCMGIYADKDGNQELLYEHVILPAKGHKAGIPARQNEQPADCTEAGSYEEIITCTVCGETLSSEIKTGEQALGHDYVLSAWDWAEDCTAEAVFICRRNPSHQVVVSADVSVNRTEPSCISEGSETYTATVNFEGKLYQDRETKTLKKTAHIPGPAVEEHDGHPDATCTEDGSYEEVVYCSYCGQELSRTFVQEKAFGHEWETTTIDGEQYLQCRHCSEKYPIMHLHNSETLIHIVMADATCTQQGYSRDFYRCKHCMELFSDAEGTHLISDAELRNLVIPALGHEGGSLERINIRPAACTQPGSYDEAVYCTRCGSLLSLTHFYDAVEPLGHDYGEPVWNWTDDNSAAQATFTCSRDASHRMTEQADIVVTRMEPDCEEDGWMHVFASVWRNGILYYDEKEEDLDKTGHREALPVRIHVVQAECETAGSYDEAVYCENCGKLLKSTHHENAVPPLGHLWSEWTKQGDKLTRTCSRCETVQEIGEAPHVHQMKPDPGKEATCIETGVAPGYVCTICGGHFVDEEGTQEAQILPLKDHTPGEVEIEFDPEDLDGYYECVYCTVCGTMLSLDWVDVPDHGEGYQGYYYSDATRVWVKGSGKPAAFTVKRSEQDQKTYGLFQYISIDGAKVDNSFYNSAPGSLILTLLPDYLENKLSLGRHTLTTVFYDGQASADFVIIAPGSGSGSYSGSGTIDTIYYPKAKTVSNNPRTGDESHLALWGMLAAVSVTGALFLAKKRKHREN